MKPRARVEPRRPSDPDLLVEIGAEELPVSDVIGAIAQLETGARAALESSRLTVRSVRTYGTPRRLVLFAEGVARRQAAVQTQIIGPPASAAFDREGRPTRAAEGFAGSQGIAVGDLTVVTTDRGRYVAVLKTEPSRPTATLLREVLPRIIDNLSFVRSMRWEKTGARFARPIRWLVALYDGKVVPFSLAGVPTGHLTQGHRSDKRRSFRSPATWAAYSEALERHDVIVDQDRRRSLIQGQLAAIAQQKGGRLVEDADLVEQATFLTESPCSIFGTFERRYLELPREVVVTVMKNHQGYFSLVDRRGRPMAAFIAVSNQRPRGRGATLIRTGYERVLQARLEDARFYFEQDQKEKLADRVERLKGVVFQERLGTVYEKVQRLIALCGVWAPRFGVDRDSAERAARLCKADLTTGMVREFPELQGVMGREYARRQQESTDVAIAIGEHYRPRFAGDEIPASAMAQVLALSDKADTIVRCFSAGLIPSGSFDPYALRRQGLGIIQILRARPVVSLTDMLDRTVPSDASRAPLVEFFRQRIESQAKTEGHPGDLINAVLAVPDAVDRPWMAFRRLSALTAFARRQEFESLMIACKRVMNILPKERPTAVDPTALTERVERRLHEETVRIAHIIRVEEEAGRDDEVLEAYESLRPAIDDFFTGVLVMAEDLAVRNARLALLNGVNDLLARFADFRLVATATQGR